MSARSSLVRGVWRANPGRTRLMVAAIAVGVGASGAILGSYTVIDRTISEDFASTNPPAATITLAEDARGFLGSAAAVEGVTAAEARREVTVRMSAVDGITGQGWQRLTLVAVDDADGWAVARAFGESGAWPPGPGEIVVERASLNEVNLSLGDTFTASSPRGATTLTVAGLAYDPGRTPAWMFGNVVGFVSPETLANLGVGNALTTIAIRTSDGLTREQNREIAGAVRDQIQRDGGHVASVIVPVPGEHPARGVMSTLLYLLQAFGAVALVAAAALVATLVVAEVKRSQGSIAAMKTGGATARQVGRVYTSALLTIALAGLGFGLLVGMAGTWALSSFALALLNLDATSMVASWWVFPVQAAIAILVPVAAVALPVRRLSRVPVKDGLADGVGAPARTPRRTSVAPRGGRALQLGMRNATRQPSRLGLTALSLAVGAAAVMTSLNTGAGWDRIVADEFVAQDFDVQLQLASPILGGSLDRAVGPGGLTRVEYWNIAKATIYGPDGVPGDVATVFSAPADTTSAAFPVIEGRLLEPGDDHAAVVTQNLIDPRVAVGDALTIEGDAASWTVVGVVRQLSGGDTGAVWISEPIASMPRAGFGAIRVAGTGEQQALEAAQAALADARVGIVSAVTATDAKASLNDHLYIITALLLLMSISLGIVGLLALVEAMSTAVAERGGEIALLKTVGAGSRVIIRMVVIEALVTALLAVAAGVILAIPLTALVESAVGTIFVGAALPYTWWLPGVVISAVVMTGAAVVSAIVPAYEAADLPVREVLARG